LPELVLRFRALHPQITVELLVTDTPLDLASNRIDLALRATPGDLPDMGYRASTIVGFRIGLYASPAYLAARGEPASPAELAEHELVAAREFSGAAQLSLSMVDPVVKTTPRRI
jgi:DNA-binding transcriptional LysR family regulator